MAIQFTMATIVVQDYDEALDFYTNKLNFTLIEDTALSETKRWVVIAGNGQSGAKILLAKAVDEIQTNSIGNQTGGRVGFFLHTDNFEEDYQKFLSRGVKFVRQPAKEPYGTVAVFQDLYGNLWDLLG